MKTYIYMNDKIKDVHNVNSLTPEPVITIQRGKSRVYCNDVTISGHVRVRFGKLKAHGHDVRAWLETTGTIKVLK